MQGCRFCRSVYHTDNRINHLHAFICRVIRHARRIGRQNVVYITLGFTMAPSIFAPKGTLRSTAGLPFTVSPSTSYLRLVAAEAGKSCVEFTAWFQSEDRHSTVRVEFVRCISARLLCNGGEAGMGIGVVGSSKWLAETNQLQRENYPSHADNFHDVKHFFFRGHDCSVEVLAEGFSWHEPEA